MSKLTITTEVTADTEARTLNVKDHRKAIPVPREKDEITLVWTLTGAGPNAAFNAINPDDPETSGFSWIGWPDGSSPPGFKKPYLHADDNQIRMIDDNDNSGTAGGPYFYHLSALVDGKTCSTIATVSVGGTVTNPSIINK